MPVSYPFAVKVWETPGQLPDFKAFFCPWLPGDLMSRNWLGKLMGTVELKTTQDEEKS